MRRTDIAELISLWAWYTCDHEIMMAAQHYGLVQLDLSVLPFLRPIEYPFKE